MSSGNGNERLHFTATDLGGHAQVRRVWRDYFHGTDAVVFVLDAADRQVEGPRMNGFKPFFKSFKSNFRFMSSLSTYQLYNF